MKRVPLLLTLFMLGVPVSFSTAQTVTTTSDSTITSTETSSTDSTSKNTIDSTQTLKSPPPSAIAPSIGASSSDICTTGVSGAVQTQILGVSGGSSIRDFNCERLKLSKTLYDMGMKVAAVSVLCQDRRVFDAMQMAGTPCPYLGTIGQAAQDNWDENPDKLPEPVILETKNDVQKRNGAIAATGISIGLLLLLLL